MRATAAELHGVPSACGAVSSHLRERPNAAADDAHGRTRPDSRAGLFGLAVGALGIVYGDIGTSPLYALREAFEHNDLDVNSTSTYGVASIVFWALVVIISIKYLALVMRADNHGEGGILALTALLIPRASRARPRGAPPDSPGSPPSPSLSACSARPCSTATG